MTIPYKVPHPSKFIQDEVDARGWTLWDLAIRMGGDPGTNKLALDLYFAVHDKSLLIGGDCAAQLGTAFDVSPELFLNLERSWRASQPD